MLLIFGERPYAKGVTKKALEDVCGTVHLHYNEAGQVWAIKPSRWVDALAHAERVFMRPNVECVDEHCKSAEGRNCTCVCGGRLHGARHGGTGIVWRFVGQEEHWGSTWDVYAIGIEGWIESTNRQNYSY